MSSSTSSATSMVTGSAPILKFGANISHFVSIELDHTNYVLWLAQFLPILKCNNLIGLVDGIRPCPAKFKVGGDGKSMTEVDLPYVKWQQYDQSLLSWINETLTPGVLATVA